MYVGYDETTDDCDDVTMFARTQGTGACFSFSSGLSGTNYLVAIQEQNKSAFYLSSTCYTMKEER